MVMRPGINEIMAEHMQCGFYFAFEWDRGPDWNFHQYPIPAMTIWYILDGQRMLHIGQEEYELLPGDLLVLPSQAVVTTRHAKALSEPFRYLSLGLFFTIGAIEWPEWYGIPVRMKLSRDARLTEWLESWRHLARRFSASSAESAASGEAFVGTVSAATEYLERDARFRQWLAALNRLVQPHMAQPQPRPNQRLSRICNYIRLHYAGPLTAKELASRACISEGHLRAVFRESLRMSPYQYVIHVRLSKAKQLLLTTDRTLQEISSSVGFDDLSHFISLFRRKIGVTPAHYRKRSHWSV
ncbi:helix-turn-helix transcriptional regulator [Paenibacillus sp. IB182496]|uniref:Helix-turn-helix transcriptional regulator n=1 Tax=Paenibacillus sabuli TaxID=2772509 RepID=A0A927GQ20_9BACL|nr:AraC family transcriptional regulator [Paenibacillus sabuli]MBD2844064.1 helix-turn-helix transcriptional regulator [Paenibacillus sabuli]